MDLVDINQIGAFVATLAAGIFVVSYAFLARFWKTQEGLNAFLLALIVFLAGLVRFVGFSGNVNASRIAGAAIWFSAAGILIWRTGLLYRAQGVTEIMWRRIRKLRPPRGKRGSVSD